MQESIEIIPDQHPIVKRIKTIYQDPQCAFIRPLFKDENRGRESMNIADYYINLSILQEKEYKDKDKENKKKQENLGNPDSAFTIEHIHESPLHTLSCTTEKSIELKSIFDECKKTSIQHGDYQRILIMGGAGIGKSTLCQYIAHQWAAGQLWQEYQAVFWVKCRDLKNHYSDEYFLADILRVAALREDDYITPKVLREFLEIHHDQCLFLIDGYDELPPEAERAFKVLISEKNVLLTSRPMSGISAFEPSLSLQVTGFTEENIHRYIEKFFDNKNQDTDPQKSESLKVFLDQQHFFKSLAQIPVNLELICNIWHEQPFQQREHLTLTDLYQSITDWLFKRYQKKEQAGMSTISNAELQLKTDELKQNLALVAYEGMLQNKLYLENNFIQAILEKNDSTLSHTAYQDQYQQLLKSGFLRMASSTTQEAYFIHLTFQEFFAAQHIARLFHQTDAKTIQHREAFYAVLKKEKYIPRYEIVWWFTAGVLARHPEALQHYVDHLSAPPKDLIGIVHTSLMVRVLEEAKAPQNLKQSAEINQAIRNSMDSHVQHSIDGKNKEHLKPLQNYFLPRLIMSTKMTQKSGVIDQLIKALGNKDNCNTVRKAAIDTLTSLKQATSEVIEALILTLRDENNFYWVRYSAADALGSLNQATPEVLEALVQALRDKDFYGKQSAAKALGALKQATPQVLEALVQALRDQDLYVRKSAAKALGALKQATPEVIEALIQALDDEDGEVGYSAAQTLRLLKDTTPLVIEALILTLGDESSWVRGSAVAALGVLKHATPLVIEVLIHALRDKDSRVKVRAADALIQLGKETYEVIEVLIYALRDKSLWVAGLAAQVLGTLKHATPQVIEALSQAWRDNNSGESLIIRKFAIDALTSLKQVVLPEVIEAPIQELKDKNPRVRSFAAQTLGSLNQATPEVLEVLVQALKDEDLYVKKSAVAALGALKHATPQVIDALTQALKNNYVVKRPAAEALGALKQTTPQLIEALIQALKDEDFCVKKSAAEALGALKHATPEVIEALIQVLKDENSVVSTCAAKALGALKQATPQVLEALVQALRDQDLYVAVEALGSLKQATPEVIDVLVQVFGKNQGPGIRKFAITALQNLLSSLPTLPQLFSSSKPLSPTHLAKLLYLANWCCLSTEHDQQKLRYKTREKIYEITLPENFSKDEFLNALQAELKKWGFPLLERPLAKTPLHLAVEKGDIETVKQLFTSGVNINDQHNEEGKTPLMLAKDLKHMTIAEYLIDHGADLECVDRKYFSVFYNVDTQLGEKLLANRNRISFTRIEAIIADCQAQYNPAATDNHNLLNHAAGLLLGISNIFHIILKEGKRYLAHLQSMRGGQAQELEGMSPNEFLAMRVYHYIELLMLIAHHKIDLPSTLDRYKIIVALKQEIRTACETYHWNEMTGKCILPDGIIIDSQLFQAVLDNFILHLQQLHDGEEMLYQTGYTGGQYGHCIYVAFRREGDNIIVRVDNLWGGDVANRHAKGGQAKNISPKLDKVYPWITQIVPRQQAAMLKPYLEDLFKAKHETKRPSLAKIYPVKKLSQQNILSYQFPAMRIQLVGNCVVRSYSVGVHYRQGKDMYRFLKQEESKLLLKNEKSKEPLLDNPQVASKSKTLRLRGVAPENKQSLPLTTSQGETGPIVQAMTQRGLFRTVNSSPRLPSHEQLMQKFATCLNVPYQEIFSGTTAEQTLVNMAGIAANQQGAMFRRNENTTTYFLLNLNQTEIETFRNYYNRYFSGFILSIEKQDNGKIKITVDTQKLFDEVVPRLGEYKQSLVQTEISICSIM